MQIRTSSSSVGALCVELWPKQVLYIILPNVVLFVVKSYEGETEAEVEARRRPRRGGGEARRRRLAAAAPRRPRAAGISAASNDK